MINRASIDDTGGAIGVSARSEVVLFLRGALGVERGEGIRARCEGGTGEGVESADRWASRARAMSDEKVGERA